MTSAALNIGTKSTPVPQGIWRREESGPYGSAGKTPDVFLPRQPWLLGLATVMLFSLFSTAALAGPSRERCLNRSNGSQAKLLQCITQDGLRIHAEALQEIADNNDGIRASGTSGYDESADYVAQVMRDAGYRVTLQEVTFNGLVGSNVIAEHPRGSRKDIITLGAHLDSVAAGPGLNDNGSGSTALLELALMTRKLRPENRVRYAWWAFEEVGLVGSAAYLNSLTDRELDRIVLNIGPDMMGSPNAIRWIEIFDETDPGTDDRKLIRNRNALSGLFTEKFIEIVGFEPSTADEQPFLPDFVGCGFTDYCNFLAFGIPAMDAIFTGTRFESPSLSEADRFGVVAGQPSDPCYHRACDTIDNIDFTVLEENTDVTAAVLLQLMFDDDIRDFDFADDDDDDDDEDGDDSDD